MWGVDVTVWHAFEAPGTPGTRERRAVRALVADGERGRLRVGPRERRAPVLAREGVDDRRLGRRRGPRVAVGAPRPGLVRVRGAARGPRAPRRVGEERPARAARRQLRRAALGLREAGVDGDLVRQAAHGRQRLDVEAPPFFRGLVDLAAQRHARGFWHAEEGLERVKGSGYGPLGRHGGACRMPNLSASTAVAGASKALGGRRRIAGAAARAVRVARGPARPPLAVVRRGPGLLHGRDLV